MADHDGAPFDPRLDLYRYAIADKCADEYIALMRLFTETLLTDLSAQEAAALLADRGFELSSDNVELRCRQLEKWGNLVRSVRDARVATVAEWVRSRSRYQVSKLGGRVHRQVEEILRATDGAREVARELLGGTVEILDRIIGRLESGDPIDADAMAADVTTVFNNQRFFTDSVRDFYAYLHQVLSRYDLVGAEYGEFKSLLLDYVDLITADVSRHAPAVADRVARIIPRLDRILQAFTQLPALTSQDGSPAERSPGRTHAEWEELAAWYGARDGRSGPVQLRAAAEQALGQLIANAKRMLAASSTGVSRRADLLRLARWFAEADTKAAHRIFAAAFGAYPARHLLMGPDEPDAHVTAATSWWEAAPVHVPVSLRERGDRAARGRTSRVPDPGLEHELMRRQAEQAHARSLTAATELIAVGDLRHAHISPAARNLLLDQLAQLFATGYDGTTPRSAQNSDLGFALHACPSSGSLTVIHSEDGDLTVHDVMLKVTEWPQAGSAVREVRR
ncbi:TIGR02677 family protein [Nonomuraea sediminis]|uniref:TIGR02677 family protein n=1 Tax=Nonomuraea sediminis TaxID=2835864 RepID=UPI001BDDC582|nr:TIGR02677 family protein [Nonomuraea sediminis]